MGEHAHVKGSGNWDERKFAASGAYTLYAKDIAASVPELLSPRLGGAWMDRIIKFKSHGKYHEYCMSGALSLVSFMFAWIVLKHARLQKLTGGLQEGLLHT